MTWLIPGGFDYVSVRAPGGLTGGAIRHLFHLETIVMKVDLAVESDSIDVSKFLKDIVENYKDASDPKSFLWWIAAVSELILAQMEFPNVTDLIQ